MILLLTIFLIAIFGKNSKELDLSRDILSIYKNIGIIGRPVNDTLAQIKVQLSLVVVQILELDENRQILKTNCWLNYEWEDQFLKWDPEKYNGIKVLRVFSNSIWTPDIKLYNFADDRLNEHRNARIIILNTGSIQWVPQALYKTTCPVDLTIFPFDYHSCHLDFGSWTYDVNKLELEWIKGKEPVDLSSYLQSNEWTLEENNASSSEMILQKRLIPVGSSSKEKKFRLARFILNLRRNPSFHIFTLIVPSALLSTLTLVVFWLPPESPAKMMFGVNVFVAFFVLLCLLSSSVPRSVKNFPIIGSYFCLNMCMITLSTFISTCVINLYYKRDKDSRPPLWMKRIFIDFIGRKLRLCNIAEKKFPELPKIVSRTYEEDNAKNEEINNMCNQISSIRRSVTFYAQRLDKQNKDFTISSEWRTLAIVIDRTFFFVYVAVIISCILIAFQKSSQM